MSTCSSVSSARSKNNLKRKNPATARLSLPLQPYSPGPVPFDPATIGTWIYPVDDRYPKRLYQLEIATTAVAHNTLVSLPTGLGKTLIASVVLYNYYRWFPTGKIIFLAPTLPLVNQQAEACYKIMGIPELDTAIMTGRLKPMERRSLWKGKRVFYGTPQTVQKDLESGTLEEPEHVVCVVLDEAHKATGEFAYVKIVDFLTQTSKNNPKFRVLGLSATPGTNLKAIQAVIDALKINKVEARTDKDESIKQYIHGRKTEIIVVAKTSGNKVVEQHLHALLTPLLDKLRNHGALNYRGTSYTISAFQIMKARDDYSIRTGDTSMIGYFLAAQKFCQLRHTLDTQGIGTVRAALNKLRTERPKGYLGALVKSPAFETLWQSVLSTSCDPTNSGFRMTQDHASDILAKNPKLSKLVEILNEHFKLAKAKNESSRAIIFSELRDSVCEITDVVSKSCDKDLIRVRHFVGQSNGSNKRTAEDGQLQGMKQAEQQQVIQQFKQGYHNVLVCTCIGEEGAYVEKNSLLFLWFPNTTLPGLDIGDVDLIINFDTLRSPIRTIQRIGRTGRKRDGRVVCLVAEGTEERKMKDQEQSALTLAQALQSKDFQVLPTTPLLPFPPILSEQTMKIGDKFHASQVEGHKDAKRRQPRGYTIVNTAVAPVNWQSSVLQEKQRIVILGESLAHIPWTEEPTAALKRFMTARELTVNVGMTASKQLQRGRCSKLLREFHSKFFPCRRQSCVPSSMAQVKENEAANYDVLKQTQASAISFGHGTRHIVSAREDLQLIENENIDLSNQRDRSRTKEVEHQRDTDLCLNQLEAAPTGLAPRRSPVSPLSSITSSSHATIAHMTVEQTAATLPSAGGPRVAQNPYLQNACLPAIFPPRKDLQIADNMQSIQTPYKQMDRSQVTVSRGAPPAPSVAPALMAFAGDAAPRTQPHKQVSKEVAIQFPNKNCSLPLCVAAHSEVVQARAVRTEDLEIPDDFFEDDFVLPDVDDSSDSSEEDDEVDITSNRATRRDSKGDFTATVMTGMVPREGMPNAEADQADAINQQEQHLSEGDFRLPSQEESSDEEVEIVQQTPIYTDSRSPANNESSSCTPAGSSSNGSEPSPRDNAQVRGCKPTTKSMPVILDLTDTPASVRECEQLASVTSKSKSFSLTNTPEGLLNTQEDSQLLSTVACAICNSAASLERDPIICCDGKHPNGSLCNLAVHCTCYGVSPSVAETDELEWLCDPCKDARETGRKSVAICNTCGMRGGALKKVNFGSDEMVWKHVGDSCPKAKRLKKTTKSRKPLRPAAVNPCGVASFTPTESHVKKKLRPLPSKYKQMKASLYFEEEAAIRSDDDMDGDEEEQGELEAIEAEEDDEELKGFINDSSQLGYSSGEDVLDKADQQQQRLVAPGKEETTMHHQMLDQARARDQMFATPVLNRRMREPSPASSEDPWSNRDQRRRPRDSTSGLGAMHFIRSVIEHHRQGGDADEIENFYLKMAGDATEGDSQAM